MKRKSKYTQHPITEAQEKAIARLLHLAQMVLMESKWRDPDAVAFEQLMAEQEREREKARKEAEAKERGEFRSDEENKAWAQKMETERQAVIVPIPKGVFKPIIHNEEAIIEALAEDQERLSAAAKKVRGKKAYLAEIAALFSAALEKDIVRPSVLEIVQADIMRLEKRLKAEPASEEAEEFHAEMGWDFRHAEVRDDVSFEEELRLVKQKEREEIRELAGREWSLTPRSDDQRAGMMSPTNHTHTDVTHIRRTQAYAEFKADGKANKDKTTIMRKLQRNTVKI